MGSDLLAVGPPNTSVTDYHHDNVGTESDQVDDPPSPKLRRATSDLIFDNLIELGRSTPNRYHSFYDADIKLPMRSVANDIMYELTFRKWFKHLMKTVVGGEELELPSISTHFDDYGMTRSPGLELPSDELSGWDTCYYSEELLLNYYKSLPKSRKDFLSNIQAEDVLSILYEEGLHINLKEIKAAYNADHMQSLYCDLYDLYIVGKALEGRPEPEKAVEQSSIVGLFSRIDPNRNLIDNLVIKLSPFVQKSFLHSNYHTELSRLFLSAEMTILDNQPICSIKDEFTLSLAYLDWLFSMPPVLPLSSLQTGQLSTIRAANLDALFSKLTMYMIQDITFSVPPIDELHTHINPLFVWFITSGVFDGYTSITRWSSPALATLSSLTSEDHDALHLHIQRKASREDEKEGKVDTDTDSSIVIVSGYNWRQVASDAIMAHELLEFLEKNPSIDQSPYKDIINAFPPIQNIIERDLQTQLTTVQRSLIPLSSEIIFIRTLLEGIYLVGPTPSATVEKRRTRAYSYVPYEMLTFLTPASTPGLYWDQSIYILIRHVLDCIIVRDVNKGVVYSAIYSRFLHFYEQHLKESSTCQHQSFEQLDDIFNLDLFTQKVYFKQAPQSTSLNISANAGKYFSTLIVRGVLSRLPAHSKLLIKLLLHIAISFMIYLRILADYELYINTPKPPVLDPSTTFSMMEAHLSHIPSWRMFLLVIDSFTRFLASGQIQVDIPNMFFISYMTYKDCLDISELDSAFGEDLEISAEASEDAQALVKLILMRTIQIFYTQFMREEAHWAIQRGIPEHRINKFVSILHGSRPLTFYLYTITILLRTNDPDFIRPAISKIIPRSDVPCVARHLQYLLPDVKFYKQVAGSYSEDPCIYAVSAAKTLIIPLPLSHDNSNEDFTRFTHCKPQSQSIQTDQIDASSDEDLNSRWLTLKEVQQSWTCIYLRHKSIYTLDPIREENLAVYLLYRVVYNMVVCRAHGHISLIEKILTSKVLPDKYLYENPLFTPTDFASIRRYIDESNKLADELALCVQRTYNSCLTDALDLFSQSLFPVSVDLTFKDCIRNAVLRALLLRLITMFDADLATLDFSPLWNRPHPKAQVSESVLDTQKEPYVFGGESITQPLLDGSILDTSIALDSTKLSYKIEFLSFTFKSFAYCSRPYLAPQWNINTVDSILLTLHQQQGLSLKYVLFPGFYLPHELSLLLVNVAEIIRARYVVGLEEAKYTPTAISFALLVHRSAAHLSAGDLLLMLVACTGVSICPNFSNGLYLEMSLRYPIFHQILSTRILEDILAYLPENFLELLGLSLSYVSPLDYLREDYSDTIVNLSADQQELLEAMIRAVGLHPSCITLFKLIPDEIGFFFDGLKYSYGSMSKVAVITAKQNMPDSLEIPLPNSTRTKIISLKDASLRDLINSIGELLTSGLSGGHIAAYLGLTNLESTSSKYASPQDIAFVYNVLQMLVICSMCP